MIDRKMTKEKDKFMRIRNSLLFRLAKIINVLLITAPFAYCWYTYYAERLYSPFFRPGNWAVIALFMAVYIIYVKVYDAFAVSTSRIRELVYSQILALGFTDAILYAITYLLTKFIPNPLPLLAAFYSVYFGCWMVISRAQCLFCGIPADPFRCYL